MSNFVVQGQAEGLLSQQQADRIEAEARVQNGEFKSYSYIALRVGVPLETVRQIVQLISGLDGMDFLREKYGMACALDDATKSTALRLENALTPPRK